MKKLNWSMLSQFEIPLNILNLKNIYRAEFNKGFITRIHNGFFIRFIDIPSGFKNLRIYLNILLSDGTRLIKACLLDENLHDRYIQIEKYAKGEELIMEIKLTSDQELSSDLNFMLEEA